MGECFFFVGVGCLFEGTNPTKTTEGYIYDFSFYWVRRLSPPPQLKPGLGDWWADHCSCTAGSPETRHKCQTQTTVAPLFVSKKTLYIILIEFLAGANVVSMGSNSSKQNLQMMLFTYYHHTLVFAKSSVGYSRKTKTEGVGIPFSSLPVAHNAPHHQ
ncbi:hypothetical protein CEXT_598971 [Caerostris extrusa]|uniref:Uncharacterized protein n=1 Tax=Caerostris extrusa TaxID=172846 RepID=A0AAV4VTT7_CAEEX|nr:hypothetical protein CEXT_598971 [Caerostris extrusa]